MKKIIIFASLITIAHSHHISCMEPELTIFECFNQHKPDRRIDVCKRVEELLKEKPTRAIKEEKSILSPYCGMTPLDAALPTKCDRCIQLLITNGAKPRGSQLKTYGIVLPRKDWNTFAYLNWHNYDNSNDPGSGCKNIEMLINNGAHVNEKNESKMSHFYGLRPLDMAQEETKCQRCINLLKQHGAQNAEK
jgi:hypothetical protein